MPHRNRDRDALRRDAERAKAAAQRELEEARAAQRTATSRRPRVESLVSEVQERRGRNGFGHDFAISVTPRWRRA